MFKILSKNPKVINGALSDAVSSFCYKSNPSFYERMFGKSEVFRVKGLKNSSVWFHKHSGFDYTSPTSGWITKHVRNNSTGREYKAYINIDNNKASVWQVSEVTDNMLKRTNNILAT